MGLHAHNAGSSGSIPGQGTRIPHATRCDQKINKDLKLKKKKRNIWPQRAMTGWRGVAATHRRSLGAPGPPYV